MNFLIGDATRPVMAPGQNLILHIGNDEGYWGKGFVLAITRRFGRYPEQCYRNWHDRKPIEKGGKLIFLEEGEFNSGECKLGNVQYTKVEERLFVATMISQRSIRRNSLGNPPIRYDALVKCLTHVRDFCKFNKQNADPDFGWTIHMPRIGCGEAGGKWEQVEPIVKRELGMMEVNVYDLR